MRVILSFGSNIFVVPAKRRPGGSRRSEGARSSAIFKLVKRSRPAAATRKNQPRDLVAAVVVIFTFWALFWGRQSSAHKRQRAISLPYICPSCRHAFVTHCVPRSRWSVGLSHILTLLGSFAACPEPHGPRSPPVTFVFARILDALPILRRHCRPIGNYRIKGFFVGVQAKRYSRNYAVAVNGLLQRLQEVVGTPAGPEGFLQFYFVL